MKLLTIIYYLHILVLVKVKITKSPVSGGIASQPARREGDGGRGRVNIGFLHGFFFFLPFFLPLFCDVLLLSSRVSSGSRRRRHRDADKFPFPPPVGIDPSFR